MLTKFDRMRRDIPDSEKQVVHLLRLAPERGAIAVCEKCRVAFKSDAAIWTTDSHCHGGNRFKGAFRSCSQTE
jgi:hypothetical protein